MVNILTMVNMLTIIKIKQLEDKPYEGFILIETIKSLGGLEIEIYRSDLEHAIEGHIEINLDKIKNTLANPSRVIESKKQNGSCLFYSMKIENNDGEIYICVVVATTIAGKGKMITAYESDRYKDGKVLYPSEE